jgi:hypothetical protein
MASAQPWPLACQTRVERRPLMHAAAAGGNCGLATQQAPPAIPQLTTRQPSPITTIVNKALRRRTPHCHVHGSPSLCLRCNRSRVAARAKPCRLLHRLRACLNVAACRVAASSVTVGQIILPLQRIGRSNGPHTAKIILFNKMHSGRNGDTTVRKRR